jgi:acetolactate synthase I/II/III large subunit
MLGGHAVAQCLHNEGVKHIFSVPGESYIAVVDGIYNHPDVKLITNRQEGCAAFMAEGYAKATRTPGVCLVTRGPGATSASIGVHSAKYDSAPLVMLVGQVGRNARGREAGQELDYEQFFGSIAKWVIEINDPKQIPRIMSRAFHIARTGRPGPVIVSLPRDVTETDTTIDMIKPYPPVKPNPDPAVVETLIGRINAAKKPVLLIGSGTQYSHAWKEVIDFAEKFQLPVLTSYKRQDAFPNNHPNYAGNMLTSNKHAQNLAYEETDLLIVLGSRLSQQTTAGFQFPRLGMPFVHIDADEENIGQNARPEVGIVADSKQFLLAALKHPAPRPNESRASWIAEHHAAQKAYCTPKERPTPKVSMERVMMDLRAAQPVDTITTTDAGSFGQWQQRFIEFDQPNSYISPSLGCMGPGVPSAVAAKLAYPDRTVVAHVGDGGFLMTGQELATAKQYNAPIIAIVYNNEGYNSIRMHQEAQYPDRRIGVALQNPDFALMGESYGALGLKVTRDEDFLPAFKKALSAGRSALIEVQTDYEYVTPTAKLTELRGKKLAGE